MDKQIFIDVYNNIDFSNKVQGMLKNMYRHNKSRFDEQAGDFEDFVQEMWCQLFEEPKFSPDLSFCFNSIKRNAMDYIRIIKARHLAAPMVSLDESEEYA